MKKIKSIVGSILREILDIFFWIKVPRGEFKSDGISVESDFIDKALCKELVETANKIFSGEQEIHPGSWINERSKEFEGKVDTKVKAIFSFEKNNEELKRFIDTNKLQSKFQETLGYDLILRNCSLQYDEPDTETKRSFHTDNNPPPSFKAFIYLTDVPETKTGPFTAITGSHRFNRYLRIRNIVYNLNKGLPTSNMDRFIPKKEETPFCGKAGTLILSTQTLFHRGNPKHSEKTRYVLIFYFSLKKYGPYPEFTLGK